MGRSQLFPPHLLLFDFEIHNNPRIWIDENTLCVLLLSELQAVNGLKGLQGGFNFERVDVTGPLVQSLPY